MSTLAYAQLTNKRESADSGQSTSTQNPGVRTYIDAFAALVPSEVLSLHGLIIATTTKTEVTNGKGTTTTIAQEAVDTLSYSFWGLLILSIILYSIPRYMGGKWDKWDCCRASIAPLAFVGWTMLQRATAFDAVFPDLNPINRTVIALFLGAVLGGVTVVLALKADSKPPDGNPPV
ncbi:MAG: hypothetical protein JST84_04160 [Acidobacteria bacterium]|nr:hypothetical protein [Acidobacteriota bacterium]